MNDYKYTQTIKYHSHEAEVPHWANGQRRCIDRLFSGVPRDVTILDAACGDGVGLRHLLQLGYQQVVGVDFSDLKIARARRDLGPTVELHTTDLHDLDFVERFDVVYSSHSLEHCHDPAVVIANFHRALKPRGRVFLILPFPDSGPTDAHCGSDILGTRTDDGGAALQRWVSNLGFDVLTAETDSFRESEIWLRLGKQPRSGAAA